MLIPLNAFSSCFPVAGRELYQYRSRVATAFPSLQRLLLEVEWGVEIVTRKTSFFEILTKSKIYYIISSTSISLWSTEAIASEIEWYENGEWHEDIKARRKWKENRLDMPEKLDFSRYPLPRLIGWLFSPSPHHPTSIESIEGWGQTSLGSSENHIRKAYF